jgi:hypothetical protein
MLAEELIFAALPLLLDDKLQETAPGNAAVTVNDAIDVAAVISFGTNGKKWERNLSKST